jgi:hypothetical protein
MKMAGLAQTQAEMLAEQEAGFQTAPSSSGFNWDGVFNTLTQVVEKVAVPLYTQSQQAKQARAAQEYQYKIAQLQARSTGLPTTPRVLTTSGRSPVYTQGTGVDFVPILIFGGLGLAAFMLLRK